MPTSRALTYEGDVQVDKDILKCLDLDRPTSFFLYAGAGSGKTRSLVNALQGVNQKYGLAMRRAGKQVGVITFTNAACDEIIRRIDFNSIFAISTIHSFAWQLISGLHTDIRNWLTTAITADIAELKQEEQKGRPGTKASRNRIAQIDAKTRRLDALRHFATFIYNPNGDNTERNSLNHSEVIKIASSFLMGRPLMQRILVGKFPFLLIDESQDTSSLLVDALLAVQANNRERFALGLIGDTMQRIYGDGKQGLESLIPPDWKRPSKSRNYRCPKRILRLINKVRSDVDRHLQTATDDAFEGHVRLFPVPADTRDKANVEGQIRNFMATVTGDAEWRESDRCKILTLEHHIAAARMGFPNLYSALSSIDRFRTGLLDGSLALVRLFSHSVLQLYQAHIRKDAFAIARIAREQSPLLRNWTEPNVSEPLSVIKRTHQAVEDLMRLWENEVPTCRQVLHAVGASELFDIPDALLPFATPEPQTPPSTEQQLPVIEDEALAAEAAAIDKFLNVSFVEIPPYQQYVSNAAPFGTHQGVKGLEFDRVMVIMDDSEMRGFMFSYDKLFGAAERSPRDRQNDNEGRESVIDRTRRLFYVTCSRARQSLALVAYSTNPVAVRENAVSNEWFDRSEIVSTENLG